MTQVWGLNRGDTMGMGTIGVKIGVEVNFWTSVPMVLSYERQEAIRAFQSCEGSPKMKHVFMAILISLAMAN